MNFEEALKNELNSIPELMNKVFPLTAIEGVKTPYLVYINNEGTPQKTLSGYIGPNEIDGQLHVLNDTYAGLKDITKQVITTLESFSNRVIGGDGGVLVQDVSYDKPTEQYIDQLFQYVSIIPFTIWI